MSPLAVTSVSEILAVGARTTYSKRALWSSIGVRGLTDLGYSERT
jgi:hypothetical protein